MNLNSTWERLRLWGKLALRPTSWPLEVLFLYVIIVIGHILFVRETPVQAVSWAWLTFAAVMGNPIFLLLLIPFSVAVFNRGVSSLAAENRMAAHNASHATQAAIDEVSAETSQTLHAINDKISKLDDKAARALQINILAAKSLNLHRMIHTAEDRLGPALAAIDNYNLQARSETAAASEIDAAKESAKEAIISAWKSLRDDEYKLMMAGLPYQDSAQRLSESITALERALEEKREEHRAIVHQLNALVGK